MFKRWEIWLAWFEYEEHNDAKRRPVLIISPEEVVVLSAMITSHKSRDVWGEHEIINWKSAGLMVPSTVRLSRTEKLRPEDFERKIGTLHPVDIEIIKEKLGEVP